MTGRIPKGGFEWHTAADPQPHISAGHSASWGWILSPGPTQANATTDDPTPWITRGHEILTQQAKLDKSLDGTTSMTNMLTLLWRTLHDEFIAKYPELGKNDAPNNKRPWIDAALVGLRRTRAGLELRYATTGWMLFGLHSGISDRWIKSPALNWREEKRKQLAETMVKSGFGTPAGNKAAKEWLDSCRADVNTQGGPSAWLLGQQMGRGWTSGSMHVSETPFSAAVVNIGGMQLVDTFSVYDSDKALFDYIRGHKRMDLLVNKLRAAEDKDPKGKLHPRDKMHGPIAVLSVQGD